MIPGRASATATVVAASVALRGEAHALPAVAIDVARRALARAATQGSALARLAGHRGGRLLLRGIERLLLPGLADHHCARKAWLWRQLRARATAGRRLVWLGVGFDGLGRALLAAGAGAEMIETDHPDTLRERRALLCDGACGLHPLALPGQIDALAALCAAGPTTVVCEGLLMYLPGRAVLRALRRLAALPAPPELVFTALDTPVAGGRGFRRDTAWLPHWLRRHGEPFRWRARPQRLRRCLAAAGYAVAADWDGDDFGEYAIVAAPVPR